MTGLDLLLAVAGVAVTVMVVAGMILITPRGQVEVQHQTDSVPEGDVAPELDGRHRRPHPAPPSGLRETLP